MCPDDEMPRCVPVFFPLSNQSKSFRKVRFLPTSSILNGISQMLGSRTLTQHSIRTESTRAPETLCPLARLSISGLGKEQSARGRAVTSRYKQRLISSLRSGLLCATNAWSVSDVTSSGSHQTFRVQSRLPLRGFFQVSHCCP